MTLTEFLLARIAEDEADAREASGVVPDGELWAAVAQAAGREPGFRAAYGASLQHVERWSPERVLVEVAAKREIIAGLEDGSLVLRHLASGYSDHVDFVECWRV